MTRPDHVAGLRESLAPGEVRLLDLPRDGVFGPVRLDDARLARVTDDNEVYASWPQGKLHRRGRRLHLLYNAGTGHGTSDLAVHERTSDDDGRTFSARSLLAHEAGWLRGVTAWSAGADGEGTRYVVVRLRGATYAPFEPAARPNGSEHRLLTLAGGDAYWRSRRIDFPFADSLGGEAPVMYHGFRALERGFETYWHVQGFAAIGTLSVTGDLLVHKRMPIDPRDQRLCEATAITVEDGVVGFLRSETPAGTRMWWSSTSSQDVALGSVPGIAAAMSPIPLTVVGDGVIAVSCDRHGEAVLRVHVVQLGGSRSGPVACSTLDLLRLSSVASGPSGTGVPDLQVFGDRLVIAFGYQPEGSRRSAVYVVTARISVSATD